MKWRYQPVFSDDEVGRCYSLCECYFDQDGKLEAWTENSEIGPSGNSLDDLRGDLAHMLADAYKWKPVEFATLTVGMTFEPSGVDVEHIISAIWRARATS
jgi:hypothetical protein